MSTDDLAAGLEELEQAAPEYRKAEKYFDGTNPEIFASWRIRVLLKMAGISYRTNFAKMPVKVLANRLRIAAVTASDQAAQDALDEMWAANKMGLLTKSMHMRAGEYGDGFVIVWPNDRLRGGIQISYNSPLTSRIIYDPEDDITKLFGVKRWCNRGDVHRANLYYEDWVEPYISEDGGEKWERFIAQPASEDDVLDEDDPEFPGWRIPNPYGEIPMFHMRTDLPYGCPDHYDAYGPQDAINKLVAVQMGTVDFYGFPQRAALVDSSGSDDDEMLADDPFGDTDDPDGDTSATEDEREVELRSSPETAWVLRNIKELVQLPPGDPAVFIQPFLLFVRTMAQITETPIRHMDPQGDVPSGESVKAQNDPLTKRTQDRAEYLEAGHKEYLEFALRVYAKVNEVSIPDDVTVDIRWAPPEQTNALEDWDVAKAKLAAGVPPQVVLVEVGYAPETVSEWIAKTPVIELMPRVELLVKIASVAQGLGASAALGVVDPELVRRVLESITPNSGERQGGDAAA